MNNPIYVNYEEVLEIYDVLLLDAIKIFQDIELFLYPEKGLIFNNIY
jgi:hypothetical protein